MVGDPNTGGARILAPSGNARLWYLGTESRTGTVPIAESGSRYHNQYIFEGLKILATHPQRQSHFVRHSSALTRYMRCKIRKMTNAARAPKSGPLMAIMALLLPGGC